MHFVMHSSLICADTPLQAVRRDRPRGRKAEAKQLRGQALSLRRAAGADRAQLRQHQASEDAHLLGCLFSQIVRVMHVTTSLEKTTDQSVFCGRSTAPSPRRRIA